MISKTTSTPFLPQKIYQEQTASLLLVEGHWKRCTLLGLVATNIKSNFAYDDEQRKISGNFSNNQIAAAQEATGDTATHIMNYTTTLTTQ